MRPGAASGAQFQLRAGCSPRSTPLRGVWSEMMQFEPTLWSLAGSMALPTLKSLTMQIYEVVLKGWSATRKIHARRATKTGKTYIE